VQILDQISAGAYKGGMLVLGMKDGATDVSPFHGLVPDDIAAKVEAVRAQIKDGSFVVPVFTKVPTAEELEAAAKPKME
jgi:basic membrane lipoprotein Med (substrate-binding protein (PBP1-ABC) superfamily)